MLSKKKKKRTENQYDDLNIANHRNNLKEAMLKNRTKSSFTTKELMLENAKMSLDDAYTKLTAQYVQQKTARVQQKTPGTSFGNLPPRTLFPTPTCQVELLSSCSTSGLST